MLEWYIAVLIILFVAIYGCLTIKTESLDYRYDFVDFM